MMAYRHAGDAGDIIAFLPVMRYRGAGVLYLEAANYTRTPMVRSNWNGLDILLKAQPYVADVQEWHREPVIVNGNDFRARLFKALRENRDKDKSLVDWQMEAHNVPIHEKELAWLTVEPRKVAPVVFNRTGPGRTHHHIYHNPRFPWHYVWKKYRKDAVFVGTAEEHKVFCATCGSIEHVVTTNLYEAAQVIAGSDLFVGNQSVCFWIAEAMKKRLILEVWPQGPNCLVYRPGAIQGWDENVELPEL